MSALLDSTTRTNDTRSGSRAPAQPALTPDLAKRLLLVAFRPTVVVLTLISAIILVTLVTANSDLTGTAGAIAATWLGVHQVGPTIGSTAIGVLPLLPTFGLLWMVVRGCSAAIEPLTSRREIGWIVGAAVGGPFVVTVVCLAIIKDASAVISLQSPNTLAAFAWVVSLHLGAAALGVATARWRYLVVSAQVPSWVIAGTTAGLHAIRRLLVCAAVVTVVSLLASWSTMLELLHTSDGFVGGLGMGLLSLAYLPNVVVGVGAVVVGATANIGVASIGLFGVVGGPVPGLPVLAAVPTGTAQPWWPALLVVPVYVAVQLGRECAAANTDRTAAAQAALAGGLGVGVVFGLLAFAAGGELGTFGHVGAQAFAAGAAVAGWLALLGSASAFIFGRNGTAAAARKSRGEDEVRVVAEPVAIDAEIVEDDPQLAVESGEAAAHNDGDIVEAEVVEAVDVEVDAADAEVAEVGDADVVDAEVVDLPEAAPGTAD